MESSELWTSAPSHSWVAVLTLRVLPIFFLYCLGYCSGDAAPAEVTSRAKSSSSRSRLCSMARLMSMQSCRLTPRSPSRMTRILLSAPMVKSIKNRDGCASRAWFKRVSTLSFNITNRNERGDSKSPHEYYISVQWRKYTTNIAFCATPLRPKNYLTKKNNATQNPVHQNCLTPKV